MRGSLQIGATVFAKWKNGYYYPATIDVVNGDEVIITYLEDRMKSIAAVTEIMDLETSFNTLQLQGNWKEWGVYYKGRIKSTDPLIMHYNDGDVEHVQLFQLRGKMPKEKVSWKRKKKDKTDQLRIDNIMEQNQLIKDGHGHLEQLKKLKTTIDDGQMIEKATHLDEVITAIFNIIDQQPELIDHNRRLISYYLPTTIKLITAFSALEKEAIKGINVLNSKTEILHSLDSILVAYKKVLNSLQAELHLDVSSDIAVLQTMLAQDGLSDDGLT